MGTKEFIPPLCFLAITLAYLHRVVLSQAIIPLSQSLDWSQEDQGWLLSSFFWGYILTQFAGSFLSQKFGAKYVLAIGLSVSSLTTAVIPFVAKQSFAFLVTLRVITGICQGATFPSVTNLIGAWMENDEFTSAIAFSWSGSYIGTALVQGLYPIIQDAFYDSWEAPFWVFGLVGLGWLLAWLVFVESSPNSKPESTDQAETLYFDEDRNADDSDDDEEAKNCLSDPESIPHSRSSMSIPFKQIFQSASVWAYFVNHFCYNWTFYFLLTYLPKYLNYTVGIEFEKAGLVAIIPYLGLYVFSVIGGKVSGKFISLLKLFLTQLIDFFIKRNVSVDKVRRGVQLIGFLIPSVFLLILTQLDIASIESQIPLILIIVTISISGTAVCGFATNPLDLSPQFSGIIVGIGNTLATLPGMISPALTGYLLKAGGCMDFFPESETCRAAWNTTFYLCIGFYVFGSVIWVLFASSKPIPFR